MGCYGQSLPITPVLDEVASDGVRFENAYTCQPVRARDKDGWKDAGSDTYTEDFLYDLKKDPYEKHNLVAEEAYADVHHRLSQKLTAYMKKAGETEPTILPYH